MRKRPPHTGLEGEGKGGEGEEVRMEGQGERWGEKGRGGEERGGKRRREEVRGGGRRSGCVEGVKVRGGWKGRKNE